MKSKALRIGLIVIVCFIGIVLAAALVYRTLYAQGVAEAFEVNSPDLPGKVLIATQGSAFKKQLVAAMTERLKQQSVYLRVIDVSALSEINASEWHALVLINTCEGGKMQADVSAYLERAKETKKIVLLITSGSGNWKPTNAPVDAISSASKKDRIAVLVPEILQRVEELLVETR